MKDLLDYGTAIERLRERKGLSREDLARTSGVSYSYLSEVERGLKRPSTDVLARLATALDMLPSDLLRYVEEVSAKGRGLFRKRSSRPRCTNTREGRRRSPPCLTPRLLRPATESAGFSALLSDGRPREPRNSMNWSASPRPSILGTCACCSTSPGGLHGPVPASANPRREVDRASAAKLLL